MSQLGAASVDQRVLAAALAHGGLTTVLLCLAPALSPAARAPLVVILALGVYWGSNTVSHINLHTPLLRAPVANRLFSLYLTLLLAVPQTLWRRRHLRHHGLPADEPRVLGVAEVGLLIVAGLGLGLASPPAFLTWLPAVALGLCFCALAGHGEHAGDPAGVDHRGPRYNRLFLNDGYHAAHHRWPSAHWARLPELAAPGDRLSRLPPLLRWLEPLPVLANVTAARLLDALERATLRLPPVRSLLLDCHRPAMRELLTEARRRGDIRRVTIVGGGLFPRSALLVAEILPEAELTLIDSSADHLDRARRWLPPGRQRRTHLRYQRFDGARPVACDLLIIPLAFRGERALLYRQPPAPVVLIHDWRWRRRGAHRRAAISWLGKQLVLVERQPREISLPDPNAGNLGLTCAFPVHPCSQTTCSKPSVAGIPAPS